MDFDTAKENIQPLRQGRRADRLETALSEQSKETLELEKKWGNLNNLKQKCRFKRAFNFRQHEDAITKYEGLDPLSAWYEYICWIEQAFPSGGTESGLDEVVLKCIVHFENDTRYKQDRRMIKLYIKYVSDCFKLSSKAIIFFSNFCRLTLKTTHKNFTTNCTATA